MAFSSLALSAAGATSGTVGAYYSAKTQKNNLNAQANIAEQNSRIAELGAQSELMRGQREEQGSRLRTAHLKSAQRTAMAANGIDLGQGSALDILTATDVMGETDANTIAANAVRSAWGYRTQAANMQGEAVMKRATAGAISPGMNAFSTLLGSAGQVASSWYGFNKAGALNGPKNSGNYQAGTQGYSGNYLYYDM